MDNYSKIEYLLNKYSQRHPMEKWSKDAEVKYMNFRRLNEQIRLFELINSEYFRLVGTQKDRAIFLIKLLDFNDICPKCTNEQMIVLICYYVKCEYIRDYKRRRCQRAFDDFGVSSNLLDKFMVYLANMNIKDLVCGFGPCKFLYTSKEK